MQAASASNLYRFLKEGNPLEAEINRLLHIPAKTALQWNVSEIKSRFLDKIVADEGSPRDLQTIARKLGDKLLAIASNRPIAKKNALALDVSPTADDAALLNYWPADVTLPFPNTASGPSTNIVFCGGSLYDILGYVMSCLGPIKRDVRRRETIPELKEAFLLPLLVLYAKWCSNIALECGTSSQKPSAVELAVRVTDLNTVYYALGASVAGFEPCKTSVKKLIVEDRRNMLLKMKFLKPADLSFPPQRILTLLERPGATVDMPMDSGAVQALPIWKPSVRKLYNKSQTDRGFVPSDSERTVLRQMGDWATQAQNNETYSFDGRPAQLVSFAEAWLNPDVYKTWDSGREYGNCAETYPLMMLKSLDFLLDQAPKEARLPSDAYLAYGGIAVTTDKVKSKTKISIRDGAPAPPDNDARYLEPTSIFSACINCRSLLQSTPLAGATNPLMFMTANARPFRVPLQNFVNQWAPIQGAN